MINGQKGKNSNIHTPINMSDLGKSYLNVNDIIILIRSKLVIRLFDLFDG